MGSATHQPHRARKPRCRLPDLASVVFSDSSEELDSMSTECAMQMIIIGFS